MTLHEVMRSCVALAAILFAVSGSFGQEQRSPCGARIDINDCQAAGVRPLFGGWDVGVEKMYLRYFGAIADFSGQYGGVHQNNFLFGLRGGAWIGRFHPFAQVMFGAVRVRESSAATPVTTFAEDIGLGLDLRMIRRLSWRSQVDELKTGSPDFERRNLRLSSGLATRF